MAKYLVSIDNTADAGSKFPTSVRTEIGVLTADKLGRVQAAKNPDTLVTGAITLDANNLIVSAAVAWPDETPDGIPGTLTITSRDATNAVLAYTITYGSPVIETYTQPTITRNAAGAATNVPAIEVS